MTKTQKKASKPAPKTPAKPAKAVAKKPAVKAASKPAAKPAVKAAAKPAAKVAAPKGKVAANSAKNVSKPAKADGKKAAPAKGGIISAVKDLFKGKPAPAGKTPQVAAKKGEKSSKATMKTATATPAAPTEKPGKGAKNAGGPKPQKLTKSIISKMSHAEQMARSILDESTCREVACESTNTTGGYCRLHYIKNWRRIKRKEVILGEGQLNRYMEELMSKYPAKYLEAIRSDLAFDKEFAKVIIDLELEESSDEFEDVEGSSTASEDTGIEGVNKRDFEDEADTFG